MSSVPTFTAVGAGLLHAVALDSKGKAWAWGSGAWGRLGNGEYDGYRKSPGPVRMPTNSVFGAISVAGGHTLALDPYGNVWGWGRGHFGQLGNGLNTNRGTVTRAKLTLESGFRTVSAGGFHSLALDFQGTAWAWGRGDRGQLGDGKGTDHVIPDRVSMPKGVTFTVVAGAALHSLALDQFGNAWAWGSGDAGQLGNESLEDQSKPVPVCMPPSVTFTSVCGGDAYSVAVDQDGGLWAWGRENYLLMEEGGDLSRVGIRRVSTPPGVTFVSARTGGGHSLALDFDGSAWAWGRGSEGQLGNGFLGDQTDPTPVEMPSGVTFTSIAVGRDYSLALDRNGSVWSWGNGVLAQLGIGSEFQQVRPMRIGVP